MESTEHKAVIYEFDGFVLDPGERTLTVDGSFIHLPAKEFDTLLYLVEHNGRALTKEELLSAIWSDSFVEESNLAKQISRLRKVLNGGDTELIETIPKHGYRFNVTYLRLREPDPLEPVIVEKRSVKRLKIAYPDQQQEELLPAALPGRSDLGRWRSATLLAACVIFLAVAGGAGYLLG